MFHIYSSAIKYLCAKYTIFLLHRGEKTRRTPLIRGDQRPPTPGRRGNPPKTRRAGEGRCGGIGTTTGDRDIVDPGHFTSESAQILIGEIMGCNRDLENIKKSINDVLQKNKNIIDVLGKV
ncbi:hypothetical protein AB205_0172460 [Aquarana catesbeiana]|uniref:Uncharacterized protein n=1 Tax=Aquarana catesbeiana TaxID=8400 RepID=A0A2G9R9D7_AQUCT|nr:hypothetical protein AB205_0172460 [Aquarana catesbeiana]